MGLTPARRPPCQDGGKHDLSFFFSCVVLRCLDIEDVTLTPGPSMSETARWLTEGSKIPRLVYRYANQLIRAVNYSERRCLIAISCILSFQFQAPE